MVRVSIDSTLVIDSMGRDYIIERVINAIEKKRKQNGYVLLPRPKDEEDKQEQIELFGDNVHKRIYYTWFVDKDRTEPELLISADLVNYDKVDINFHDYTYNMDITVEPWIMYKE